MRKLQLATAVVGLALLVLSIISQVQVLAGESGFLGHAEGMLRTIGIILVVAAIAILLVRTGVFGRRKEPHSGA